MRTDLPGGTVTLVFTDIQGSTELLKQLGDAAYAEALAEHRRLIREAFARLGGVEVDTQGDAFFYAFADAGEAVAAAAAAREALRPTRIQVRVGMHTGTPHVGPEGYVGHDVHLGARIGAAGHGGQVLLSDETCRAAGPEGVLDLGEHRLKDIDRPVRIFQLGAGRFPPLKTISNTNLPRPASSFVGRADDVRALTTLIRDGDARLVTLTGPGGSGKTRLAVEAAAELVGDHKAGTFWVELAPIRDPALVADEIATTLGASDGLAGHIGEREMLLVLDNLEQVLDAAPDLADLVEACPNLVVLATSRERLRVRGEVEYPVEPLAEQDAVELFVTRAGLAAPGDADADDAVRELCRALDEMPLAIELAAARAKVLPPAQILERLGQRLDLFTGGRDADPRQRTLRATMEWSHELLDPDEQRLFARLSVFVGGCALGSAERVADARLDTLASLVEKSLVRRTEDRYWMYETIRGFAAERLEASGEEDAIRRRHAEHFLAFAEEAEPHVTRELLRGGAGWTQRLEAELDNIRATLDRFEAEGDGERALRMTGAVAAFWEERGHVVEGRRRLEWALAADDRPTAARAKALGRFAAAAGLMGDLAEAEEAGERALELHRELGDTWRIGDDVHTLGYIAADRGDWDAARRFFEESVRLLRQAGDEDYALWATRSVGWTYHDTGDLERAREIHEANLERAREMGNRAVEATSLGVLGSILVEAGRAREAFPYLERGYRLHRELGESIEGSTDLWRFSAALLGIGRIEEAVVLGSLSAALREELGARIPWAERHVEETLAAARERLDPAAFEAALERGKRLTPDAAVALALDAWGG